MNEIVKLVTALPVLIGFGLALGLNPALYGATADTLARNQNVWGRLAWMIAGLATGATVLVLLLHSFDPRNLETMLRNKVDAAILSRNVDLIAGIVFLVAALAIVVWKRRVRALPTKPARVPKQNAASLSFFSLGLSCSIIGFTTLPIMYLTGRMVTGVSEDLPLRLLAYGVFLVSLAAPFLLLAWTWTRFPRLASKVTDSYAKAQHWDYRGVTAAFLAVAGLVLIVLALVFNR